MVVAPRSMRRRVPRLSLVASGMVLVLLACGERTVPPPPESPPALQPAAPDSDSVAVDTLVGDSVMARDTLWSPQR